MAEPAIVDDYESDYDSDVVLKVEKNRDETWINLKTFVFKLIQVSSLDFKAPPIDFEKDDDEEGHPEVVAGLGLLIAHLRALQVLESWRVVVLAGGVSFLVVVLLEVDGGRLKITVII
eukprot:561221-Prorocentrum_minimum.AAC.1